MIKFRCLLFTLALGLLTGTLAPALAADPPAAPTADGSVLPFPPTPSASIASPTPASGGLYALGGASGGLTLFMDKGDLVYEYNMMVIERYQARSKEELAPGRHKIEVTTTLTEKRPLTPAEVVLTVDGKEMARTTVKRTVPGAFTASETFERGRGPVLPGVLGLFRPGALPLQWQNCPGGSEDGIRAARSCWEGQDSTYRAHGS
jgi:hypothetical protein